MTFPLGAKVVPSTSTSTKSLPASLRYTILLTLIWLVVKVPVLSEQITLQLPKVSTDGRLRTTAFLAAIFLVPRARQVVITTAKPSGIAATPRETAILR